MPAMPTRDDRAGSDCPYTGSGRLLAVTGPVSFTVHDVLATYRTALHNDLGDAVDRWRHYRHTPLVDPDHQHTSPRDPNILRRHRRWHDPERLHDHLLDSHIIPSLNALLAQIGRSPITSLLDLPEPDTADAAQLVIEAAKNPDPTISSRDLTAAADTIYLLAPDKHSVDALDVADTFLTVLERNPETSLHLPGAVTAAVHVLIDRFHALDPDIITTGTAAAYLTAVLDGDVTDTFGIDAGHDSVIDTLVTNLEAIWHT